MIEFTGERVVPGQVDDDLWAEHLARYAFAARLAAGAAVLDAGSGTGYGAAELARTANRVVALDPAHEALVYARTNYPGLEYLHGSIEAIPVRESTFDLITAFEVIEHVANWSQALDELARVLAPAGVLAISTPNRLYYAEARAQHGPNEFHSHEFEFEEFRDALAARFPHVQIFLQNRTEVQAFYPHGTFLETDSRLDSTFGEPNGANFFVALCSRVELTGLRSFAYVPAAGNLLRVREQHIAKLDGELALNRQWLDETRQERDTLIAKLAHLQEHLEQQNRWALDLDTKWREAQARIVQLQEQFAAEQEAAIGVARQYETKVAELEAANEAKTRWAQDTEKRLTAEIESQRDQMKQMLAAIESGENQLVERTRWAVQLRDQLDRLEAQLNMTRASRWIALGRKLGVGPRL